MDFIEKIRINEYISYWKDSKEPLSANVGIVVGKDYHWIFDVGSHPEIPKKLVGERNKVILSHFHPDHCENLDEVLYEELYVGKNTYGYIHKGIIVEKEITMMDGDLKVSILPIPSSHAKGSLGMEINDTYLFLGDATYATRKAGKVAYNTQQLLALIRLLESRKAQYVLLSHQEPFLQKKEVEVKRLKMIYETRVQGEAYIEV